MKTHLLRKLFLLLIVNCSLLIAKAQWVTIPDANFRTWLNANGYSNCMSGNQLDTTCFDVETQTDVYLINENISNLTGIQYFDNLQLLDCGYNQLTSLPPLPRKLVQLYCDHNQLTSLPALSDSLSFLQCSFNQLTSLPALPNLLTDIRCNNNLLTSLPLLPDTLIGITCNNNQLASLPALPVKMRNLVCQNNQLTGLPVLPDSLFYLNCGNNPLGSLPSLPNRLETIYCYQNQLTSLPVLPPNLVNLYCYQNSLTALPTLPPALIEINCSEDQLTSLPLLPSSLRKLTCSINQLSSLPPLPTSMNTLLCDSNQLSSLPSLPANVRSLNCSKNHLISIPELPDSVYSLFCSRNPTLYCLPQLKKIVLLDFSNTGVSCLPNYPSRNTYSNPLLNSIPLCGVFNTNGCDIFWNISGKVYQDDNSNCLDEPAEIINTNVKINLYHNGILLEQAFTGSGGFYSFDVDSFGTYSYSADTTSLPYSIGCPSAGFRTSVINALDSTDFSMDFGFECKPGFDIEAHSIVPGEFRAAELTDVNIGVGDATNFYGAHCSAGVSGVVTITLTGPVTYVSGASGALTPSNVSGNTITYNVADFGNTNFFNDFNFVVQTDTNALLDSQVCITVNVTPTAGDNNPANNTLTQCFIIVGSFDPNDKSVSPPGNIDTAQDWLTYTVRFQNTGTDTAIHIYITDTLDTDLDASSFQLLAYSHQPMVQIVGNAVRFNYPNINLPDSNVNEPASNGYVQYRVRLNNNLVGTQVNNTAYIYFDFNAPVITNTVTNTVVDTTGTGTCLPTSANLTDTICSNELYFFGGVLITNGGVYYDTLTNANGCDSVVQLTLSVRTAYDVYISATICESDSYFFDGHLVDTAGVYTQLLSSVDGCDSLIELTLTVIPTARTYTTAEICMGDSLVFGNQVLYTSGVYIDALSGSNACDSVVYLTLTVHQYPYLDTFSASRTLVCIGDTVHFSIATVGATSARIYQGCVGSILVSPVVPVGTSQNPTILEFDWVYTYGDTCRPTVLLHNPSDCDSYYELPLVTVLGGSISPVTICDNQGGHIFNGDTLNNTGVYYDTLQNMLGCDSIIRLFLTVNHAFNVNVVDTICENETFLFRGQLLHSSGFYSDTLTQPNGCLGVITLNLTVDTLPRSSTSHSICQGDSFSFGGDYLTQAGTYYDTVSSVTQSCDMVVTLHLSVLQENATNIDTAIMQGSAYALPSGDTVSTAGTYTIALVGSNGCDSVVTVNLSVISGISKSAIRHLQFEMFPNPASDAVTISISEELIGNSASITDITGRRMLAVPLSTVNCQLSTVALESGVYFVTVTHKEGVSATKKLVVSK